MRLREKWARLSQTGPMRTFLVGLGFLLIALTPFVGPIPGPGGIIVFGAGLTLVLKYSGWAKRLYVRLKRKHPKKGAWADWSLRRQSAQRRHALNKEREAAGQAASVCVPAPAESAGAAPAGPDRGRERSDVQSAEASAAQPDRSTASADAPQND